VTGDNAIVDWVVVEVRNSANYSQVLFSRPALVQRDGDVMDLDGNGYVNFPTATGSYYVAVRHRNHLGVMSSSASLGGTDISAVGNFIDFKIVNAAYGSNGPVSYSGDNNDRDPILIAVGGTTPNNAVSNVYDRRDTNLDGVIKYTGTGNDRDIILTNVGSTTPNNTRTQQLP
jgi:hypothetical protein